MRAKTAPRTGPAAHLILATLGLALLVLVVFGRLPGPSKWASDLGNAAHGPAFAIVVLIVFALLRAAVTDGRRPIVTATVAVVIAAALGAATELVQAALGRDAAWGDLGRDVLGALTGGFLIAAWHSTGGPASRWRTALLAAGILCGLMILAPFAVTAAAYGARTLGFPTLVDFRSPLSGYFLRYWGQLRIARERIPVAAGRSRSDTALHVRIEPRRHWSVALWEPVPDWHDFTVFNLDVVNPTDTPLQLTVWIRDRGQGSSRTAGHRRIITIPPRARRVAPLALAELGAGDGAARVDIKDIHSVILQRARTNQAREFYLLRMFLE